MKKILTLLIPMVMVFALAGCGAPEEEQPEEQIQYDIAMVTDASMIMDGGYSEAAWTAISEFGAAEGVSHKYYKAAEASEAAYREAIDNAVDKGAGIIIADGYSFEDVVYNAQAEYKDVKFVLIDAEPVDRDSGETKIGDNTVTIIFASQQAGYLAGYSAVKDGKTQLGFIGDSRNSDTMDYGYGFLQGAEAAAEENGVEAAVKYHYCTGDEDKDAIMDRVSGWYEAGTEAVFACGSRVEQPVIEAAEMADGKVIAFETDKSGMSDTVMTSAVKNIGEALNAVLESYKDDEFAGGSVLEYNAANDGIMLNMETGRFTAFTESEYEAILAKLADGTVQVKDHGVGDLAALRLLKVAVTEE